MEGVLECLSVSQAQREAYVQCVSDLEVYEERSIGSLMCFSRAHPVSYWRFTGLAYTR